MRGLEFVIGDYKALFRYCRFRIPQPIDDFSSLSIFSPDQSLTKPFAIPGFEVVCEQFGAFRANFGSPLIALCVNASLLIASFYDTQLHIPCNIPIAFLTLSDNVRFEQNSIRNNRIKILVFENNLTFQETVKFYSLSCTIINQDLLKPR